jgi:hypothetical protein
MALCPFSQESGLIGKWYERGRLATVVIQRFLEWVLGIVDAGTGVPGLVAATPVGERHELVALPCAASGAAEAYESTSLGPDSPAEEIVSAAQRLDAQVVALSCVDPRTAGSLAGETRTIRNGLPVELRLVLRGQGARSCLRAGGMDGVWILDSFKELRESLRELLSPR